MRLVRLMMLATNSEGSDAVSGFVGRMQVCVSMNALTILWNCSAQRTSALLPRWIASMNFASHNGFELFYNLAMLL